MNTSTPDDRGLKKRTDKRKYDRQRKRKKRAPLIWELVEHVLDEFLLQNYYTDDLDLDTQNAVSHSETVEPPSNFILPLLRYQKEWLAWSLSQEKSKTKGGILADEKGMGKTVQAIALVLTQRELLKDVKRTLAVSSSSPLPVVKGTLVVCPVIGAMQWFHEIERCTTKGSNKTLVYHGDNKEKCMYKLAEYDFVITTYYTIEADNMSKQLNTRRGKSVLHSVKWNRIILDEAYYIKSVHSNTTQAILALESTYKWALTGIPLQDRTEELYPLVRFLRVYPYAYYFCKDCDARTLDFSLYKCPKCPHQCARQFLWWNKYIEEPLKRKNDNEDRDAMVLLKHRILKKILLKRTKKGKAADLALPSKTVTTRKDSLDIGEYETYKSVYRTSLQHINRIQAGTLMKNYCDVFPMIVRLRQAVDHPYFVSYARTELASGNKKVGFIEPTCDLCQYAVEDPVVTSCSHMFCKACLIDFVESTERMTCPSCTEPLTFDFTTKNHSTPKLTVQRFSSSSIMSRIHLNEFETSTKIKALIEEIGVMQRDDSAKGIVFSQFTSFLDLIQYSLHLSRINSVQLVGSMSITARDAAVNKFTKDSNCKILLMSLKDGGISISVTFASHIFLMDTWWNPAVEQQAQDRIRRIGQHEPVKIVRFVIKDTIEENILELQEEKKLLYEGTVGGSPDALGKLTEQDLNSLFLLDWFYFLGLIN